MSITGAEQVSSHMIVRCQFGHQAILFFKLPMPLTDYATMLKNADRCEQCGTLGCVMLLGPEYEKAREQLKGML